MKKTIIGVFIGLGLSSLVAFTTVENYVVNNKTAEVNQMRGMYIFTDCKPVQKYEYLGTVKLSYFSIGDSQYTGVRDRLIKKVAKKYPNANGVIITFKTGGSDLVDVIKFKDE